MTIETVVALIPILPFMGFIVNGLVGKKIGKSGVALIACAAPIAAFLCSLCAFIHIFRGAPSIDATLFTWIRSDDLTIAFRFTVDRLSGVMILFVTGIGSLIHIYSSEYMEHEDRGGYARYFAYLNFFMSMMLVLVLGSSLPIMFIGWEGVGLASYLLIGFWYQNEAYANAGKKAFIVNRIGDFAFLLGIFLLFSLGCRTLEFNEVNDLWKDGVASAQLTTAAICLFIGACGKSAQIPLYVWLPDAMAGPTPVSALIHAATMVTAGVYMILRTHGLFEHAPGALALVATVGASTAFFAATMGLAENDMKKVLAYSTVSQLGYMFVGVGTGAFAAGFFHVFTHAFFKALLFLGAGVVMHALHGVTDIRKMGGLREKLPMTYWFMLFGCCALAGIPPFAGFFSKDEILWSCFANFQAGHGVGWLGLWVVGVLTAGMTAFYTFRMFTLAFLGEPRGPADVHMHAHEPGKAMWMPLAVLSIGAVFAGFLNIPHIFAHHGDRFTQFLSPVLGAHETGEHSMAVMWFAALIPTALALLAANAAYKIYSEKPEAVDAFTARPGVKPFHDAIVNKYWVDQFYDRAIVQQIKAGASSLWEYVDVALIDAVVNGVGAATARAAQESKRLATGVIGHYAFYVSGGVVIVLAFALGMI